MGRELELAPTIAAESDPVAPEIDLDAASEFLPHDPESSGVLPWRIQPLVSRDLVSRKVRIPDYAVGGKVRRLSTIGAASKSKSYPWWERPDVYWETNLFDAMRSWRHSAKAGAIFSSKEHLFPPIDAGRGSSAPTGDLEELHVLTYGRLVGLLRQLGVASTEHLGAITDDPEVRRKLMSLSEAGVIEGALYHSPGAGFPRVEMWRIRHQSRYAIYSARCIDAGLRPNYFLDLPTHGGLPGARHARHQSLSTELMLRALEISENWMGWLPEAVCLPERFLPRGHSLLTQEREAAEMAHTRGKAMSDKNRKVRSLYDYRRDAASVRADGCLLRLDGHKVFLELQAQKSTVSSATKIANWSRLLDGGPIGGVILFAVASKRGALPSTIAEIKQIIESEASPTAQPHLLVGSWIDWMPDHAQTTAECGTLRCAQLVDGKWQEVHAATVAMPEPLPDWGMLAAMPQLGSTPDWFMAKDQEVN